METRTSGDHAPLNPEEVADRIVPGEPRVLPDGRAVAFEAAPAGMPGKHPAQAIWLGREGQEPRRLTQGVAYDHSPRPAPDGRRVAFLSDRAARSTAAGADRDEAYDLGLYLIDLDGGEAQPFGPLEGKLSRPEWSHDGTAIALLQVDPETAEEKRRKDELDDRIVADENPKWSRLWLIDVATGKARCLTTVDRQVWEFAWAPDGQSLVALTTDVTELDRRYGAIDLWAIPRAGGLNRHLATLPGGPSSPTVIDGPDGPLVVMQKTGDRLSPPDAIWAMPLAGGEARNAGAGTRGQRGSDRALAGSAGRVAAIVAERLHAGIYGVEVASGTLTPLMPKAIAGKGSVSPCRCQQTGSGSRSSGRTPSRQKKSGSANRLGKPRRSPASANRSTAGCSRSNPSAGPAPAVSRSKGC